jgi:hypothetical protein
MHIKFTDVTAEVAPGLQSIGMVCDALLLILMMTDNPTYY